MTGDGSGQLPLKIKTPKLPKVKVCVDCPPRPKPLAAPHPGPRCHHHNIAAKRAGKETAHEGRVMRLFGLARGFYARLKEFQGGRCAICQRGKGINKRLAVDHDHACCPTTPTCGTCNRGLLCDPCNDFLGYIGDDPVVGERLAAYLRYPPAYALRAIIAMEQQPQQQSELRTEQA